MRVEMLPPVKLLPAPGNIHATHQGALIDADVFQLEGAPALKILKQRTFRTSGPNSPTSPGGVRPARERERERQEQIDGFRAAALCSCLAAHSSKMTFIVICMRVCVCVVAVGEAGVITALQRVQLLKKRKEERNSWRMERRHFDAMRDPSDLVVAGGEKQGVRNAGISYT